MFEGGWVFDVMDLQNGGLKGKGIRLEKRRLAAMHIGNRVG